MKQYGDGMYNQQMVQLKKLLLLFLYMVVLKVVGMMHGVTVGITKHSQHKVML
jgi:hypothetical protein